MTADRASSNDNLLALLDMDKMALSSAGRVAQSRTEQWMRYLGFPGGILVFLLFFYLPLGPGISAAGQAGIACVACHEVHTQRTRVTASTDALCAGCHQQGTQDQMHQAHRSEDIPCISCHLSRPEDKASQAVSGHAVTGHSFAVDPTICADCHPDQP